jgi:hypothetical protein
MTTGGHKKNTEIELDINQWINRFVKTTKVYILSGMD